MWNGMDAPPGQDPRDRKLVSKNGHQIRFLDSTPNGGNMGALIIQDAHGNTITLSNGQINITSVSILSLNAPKIMINNRIVAPNANAI